MICYFTNGYKNLPLLNVVIVSALNKNIVNAVNAMMSFTLSKHVLLLMYMVFNLDDYWFIVLF